MPRYLIRLDDVTPAMDMNRFEACMDIFKAAGIRPILGIVPDNRDPSIEKGAPSASFWETMRGLARERKITIAQHGLHHVYHRHQRSLLRRYGVDAFTEFAGLPYGDQLEKIRRGRTLLAERGLVPAVWMTPNHSFDRITLKALPAGGFTRVTDGVGFYPYRKDGLVFFPVLSGKPRRVPCGLATICLHPNTMSEADFSRLRAFLSGSPRVVSFEEAVEYRPPWFAPVANALCRIAYFLIKSALRLRRRKTAPFPGAAAAQGFDS